MEKLNLDELRGSVGADLSGVHRVAETIRVLAENYNVAVEENAKLRAELDKLQPAPKARKK